MDIFTSVREETKKWRAVQAEGNEFVAFITQQNRRSDGLTLARLNLRNVVDKFEGILERMIAHIDELRNSLRKQYKMGESLGTTPKTSGNELEVSRTELLLFLESWLHSYETEYENKLFVVDYMHSNVADSRMRQIQMMTNQMSWEAQPFLNIKLLQQFVHRLKIE